MMTTTDDYLARLDHALRDLPHGVATEIRDGIAEELGSLSPDAAERRIAQLGDPAEIAREAMNATGASSVPPSVTVVAAAPKRSVTSSRGFAIIAAIALGAGGFIVPFVGWVFGVAMVLMSSVWRAREKVVAVLLPFGVSLLLFAVSAITAWWGWQSADESNPLVPDPGMGAWHWAVLLSFLAFPISGLWLLWRLRGRPVS